MEVNHRIGRNRRSYLLAKSALRTLLLDKKLLFVPVIGAILSFIIFGLSVVFFVLNPDNILYSDKNHTVGGFFANNSNAHLGLSWYAFVICVVVILSLISTFVSATVIHAALTRFNGKKPSLKASFKASLGQADSLIAFGLFSYTVGYILSRITNKVPFVGGFIVRILAQFAWGIATFFSIPVIIDNDKYINPLQATKQSAGLVKKVWGESIIANTGVGLVALLWVVGYVYVLLVLNTLSSVLSYHKYISRTLFYGGIAGLITMFIVIGVLSALIKAAIYFYAVTGESPVEFDKQLLHQSFTRKKARRVFSH